MPCLRAEHPVGRAAHGGRAPVEDVGVDHRRRDVAVAEEFLHGADVVAVFEQVGRERMLLRPLAVADDDQVCREVNVLDAEARAFEQAQAGTVEEQRQEAREAVEVLEDGPDLVARHDDGQVLGSPGADDVVEPRQVLLEHLAVEEQQCPQRGTG